MKFILLVTITAALVESFVVQGRRPCPKNKPRHYCLIRPCKNAKCQAFPSATCFDDYCGGCFAHFYLRGRKVNCNPLMDNCPPGVHIVYCLVDPCQVTKCKTYPNATCKSNYCGGCNADFFVNGKKVFCTGCPPGVPTTRCKADPCEVTKCKAYPTAKCVANYCGGCNADFFVNGKKVDCNECPVRKCLPCPEGGDKSNYIIDENGCQTCRCKSSDSSCAAVTCLTGHKCVVKNGKASCKILCKSNSDCSQGAFCQSGICECGRFCPAVSMPVCGSDGQKYGNVCQMNIAACEKNMNITPVDCPVLTGCARVLCVSGTICREENGKAKCVPSCAALLCLVGEQCVLGKERATCQKRNTYQ